MAAAPFVDVDALLAALGRGATVNDDRKLDVLAHSLQCGQLLRIEHPDDPELAVAGLVHDVWDTVSDDHDAHDTRGAALVEPLLGARVARLVAGHVVAKRYLVAHDDAYRAQLSDRSAITLVQQGGILGDNEVRALEASPDFAAIVTLRRADERAKVPGAAVPELGAWRSLLEHIARARRT